MLPTKCIYTTYLSNCLTQIFPSNYLTCYMCKIVEKISCTITKIQYSKKPITPKFYVSIWKFMFQKKLVHSINNVSDNYVISMKVNIYSYIYLFINTQTIIFYDRSLCILQVIVSSRYFNKSYYAFKPKWQIISMLLMGWSNFYCILFIEIKGTVSFLIRWSVFVKN